MIWEKTPYFWKPPYKDPYLTIQHGCTEARISSGLEAKFSEKKTYKIWWLLALGVKD